MRCAARPGRLGLIVSLCIVLGACSPAHGAQPAPIPELPPPAAGAVDELTARQQIVDKVSALMDARDFAGLDRLATEYREGRERTGSGKFKSSTYYQSIYWYLFNRLEGRCSPQAQAYVEDWIAAAPQSAPAILAYADFFKRKAFCARGNGFASSVAPDAWPIFNANIDKSAAILLQHKAVGALDPEWYAQMQQIATYQQWDDRDFEKLHAEAVSRFAWSYDVYFSAIPYYQPQWGGSMDKFDQFARRSAEATKASDGLGLYARIYWFAYEDCVETLRRCTHVDMKLLRASMRDVAVRYPDAWNYNNFAWILCANEDLIGANDYLRRLSGDPPSKPWPDAQTYYACKTYAGAAAAEGRPR